MVLYNNGKKIIFFNGSKIKIMTVEEYIYDESEIPYISINYYNPKPYNDEYVTIPIYITDFYQREYAYNDNSLKFKLRYELDGIVNYVENLSAGDYNLAFGILAKGNHWYTIQVMDKYGRESRRIYNELLVIDRIEAKTYIMTEDDLITYNLNNQNSEVEQCMTNNRIGLTNMFFSLQSNGYKKCIMLPGIYRVNKALRSGVGNDTPVYIPTNFTVDMNGCTFKLHPYNDSDYTSPENIIINFSETIDSHLINGIIEGDYAERIEKGWASDLNGETCNAIGFGGAEYCTLDNVTIKQVSGYNLVTGKSLENHINCEINSFENNIAIVNGKIIAKEGYTTCNFFELDTSEYILGNCMVVSAWLGYGGIRGICWHVDVSFYDVNKIFIETIRIYQYTRCRIPKNSKYCRVTGMGSAEQFNGIYSHNIPLTRYSSVNNCHWVDNRTCAALGQIQHFRVYNCDSVRSGQSITPCVIDLEDGWENTQDVFFENINVLESSGSADIIDCAGINHIYENCINNIRLHTRYRIRGLTIRNSKIDLNNSIGWMTGNTIRIYNNQIVGLNLGETEDEFLGYKKTKIFLKNNNIDVDYVDSGYKFYTIIDSSIKLGTNKGISIKNCEVYYNYPCYTHSNVYISDSTIKSPNDVTNIIISMNEADAIRIYDTCIYESPTILANHNYFNSGTWTNCTFKDTVSISAASSNTMGDLSFTNCTFEGNITLSSKNGAMIQFNDCTFLGTVSFENDGETNSEFNNCIGV